MFGNKRFKSNPTLDAELNQPAPALKRYLELLCQNFYGSRMRNMEVMDTSTSKLYGLLTHYESQNYFWLQPTRIKTMVSEIEYHNYVKQINRDGRNLRLLDLREYTVGEDCVARYYVDSKWYRAIIIRKEVDGRLLIFFIDYGNTQVTAHRDIKKPIVESQCNHYHAPVQAVCCRLYNVVPKLPEMRKQMDHKLKEFFNAHMNDFVEIQVRHVRPDYVVDCDIFICKKSSDKHDRLYRMHIGQELVDSGLATFADPNAAHAIKIKPEDLASFSVDEDSEEEEDIKTDLKAEVPDTGPPRQSFKREYSPIKSESTLQFKTENPFNRQDSLSRLMNKPSIKTENSPTTSKSLFGKETLLSNSQENPFAQSTMEKNRFINSVVKHETKPCLNEVSPFGRINLSNYSQFKFTQNNPFC